MLTFRKYIPNIFTPPKPPLKGKNYCNSNVHVFSFSPGFPIPLHPKDFYFKFSLRNSFLVEMRMYWHLWNLIFCEDKNSCHLLQLLFFSYMYLYLRLSTIKVMHRKCIACKFSWTIWWRSSLLVFFLHPLCLIFQAYVECLYVNHHLCENIIKKNKQNFVAN